MAPEWGAGYNEMKLKQDIVTIEWTVYVCGLNVPYVFSSTNLVTTSPVRYAALCDMSLRLDPPNIPI